MRERIISLYKRGAALLLLFVSFCSVQAQTDLDGIMMNRNQFCNGFMYTQSSWSDYWEGTLKRNNENLGTVSNKSVMYMANYGITHNLNVMVGLPYVSTKASAGTLHGMKGIQDLSLFVKYRKKLYQKGDQKLFGFITGGVSAPMSDYVIDHLPLSVGLGSKQLIGRLMLDYQIRRFTITGSATYVRRSNVTIDRNSYYDTELHLTNEVKMPDAAQYQLRAGYRGKYLIAEALLTNWTTLGGFDITRNNMPFPSNRMNATQVGTSVKYTIKQHTNLAVLAGYNHTIAGRNMGQAGAFNVGAFYALYFKKNSAAAGQTNK